MNDGGVDDGAADDDGGVAEEDAGHDDDDENVGENDEDSSLMMPHLTLKYFQQLLHYTWHLLKGQKSRLSIIITHYRTDRGASH